MSKIRSLHSLDDESALSEARRLAGVAQARWKKRAAWFGVTAGGDKLVDPLLGEEGGHSPFEMGMLALFRYARGKDVPAFIVQDFVNDLLDLLFAGLASGALAIPRFEKMADRPWAHAWRLAELRLKLESGEQVRRDELAHLLGVSMEELEALVGEDTPDGDNPEGQRFVSADGLRRALTALRESGTAD